MADTGLDDLLREFLAESAENLARLDQDVVELERDPSNTSLLNSIFRTIHTIKGTCGFLDLARLEGVSHTAESVLDLLRLGTLRVSPDVISDILRAVDVIKEILAELNATGVEQSGDDTVLIARLERWLTSDAPEGRADPSPSRELVATPSPRASVGSGSMSDNAHALPASSLRVDVAVLDALMNLAGELVLARNRLLQMTLRDEGSVYAAPVQQLNRITTELQGAVMKTRMQPISSTWSKLPRLVRDIARATGKEIELSMSGGSTELDRQLVQAVQDPLMHMIRNSADHGIELPDQRRAAGKSETGHIHLGARHEGGQVIIEITDDGVGIDPVRIRQTAVERGLVRQDVADGMTDNQILRFVFEPGFSTASSVTHISGRGVGMDVVRDNISSVGGTIELQSERGQGCTVRIRLPLTLAIVSSLLVSVAGECFVLPQSCVLELLHVPGGISAFEEMQDVPLYRLRGTLLPVIVLRDILQLGGEVTDAPATLLVCQVGAARFGIVVDDVDDTQEIVVKPVGRSVRQIGCYSGCTILGDGRVILILDPAGIATLGGMKAAELHASETQAAVPESVKHDSLLLFEGDESVPQAVPLSSIARLEEIPSERFESADGRSLVQYGGILLPVVGATGAASNTGGRTRSVIVFNDGDNAFGIAVHEIHDIVEDTIDLDLAPSRPGVLGTAVIAGRATEVLDVSYYFAQSRAARAVS